MNANTVRFLGLAEELTNIAEKMQDETISIHIDNQGIFPVPVMVHLSSLEELKRYFPDTTMSDYTDIYDKESRIFFDKVEVFCLHAKEAAADAG